MTVVAIIFLALSACTLLFGTYRIVRDITIRRRLDKHIENGGTVSSFISSGQHNFISVDSSCDTGSNGCD